MSKIIASTAIRGAHKIAKQAEDILAKAIKKKGEDCEVNFPNTGYYIPIIYSMTGRAVEKLADFKEVIKEIEGLLPPHVDDDLWVPYLGHTLDAGMATLFAEEIIEACKYLIGPNPVDGIWLGAADDVIMRERGIQFVDGTAPGFAAVVGAAPDVETAVEIARKLQERSLYVFMHAHNNGATFAEQLVEGGVQLGWETRLIPFGRDITSAIYALGFASRAALSFGGVQPADFRRNLLYNKNRIFAFVMALGEVTDEWYATAAGAINYGFPTIADSDIPEILPTGVCTYEHVVSKIPHDQIVEKAVEVRGLKVKITEIPIPVSVSPAFEGERIRKEDMQCEFGGQRTPAFEWLRMREIDEVEDGNVEVIGPDIDTLKTGGRLPLGIIIEVAGRKMQSDFEPVLERQVHTFLNEAQGLWHMGQRDINWVRISKDAAKAGFVLEHIGKLLHAVPFLAVGDQCDAPGGQGLAQGVDRQGLDLHARSGAPDIVRRAQADVERALVHPGGDEVGALVVPAELLAALACHCSAKLNGALSLGVLVLAAGDGVDCLGLDGSGHIEVRLTDRQVDRVGHLGGQVKDLANARGVQQPHPVRDGMAFSRH